MADYLFSSFLLPLYTLISTRVFEVIYYLFAGKTEAGEAVLVLYGLTVLTKIYAQTWLYLIEVEGLTPPISKKVLRGILTCKAWVPGYLNLNYLENKGLLRWLNYSLLLVVGRQLEKIHPYLQDLTPDLVILLLGINEVRSILKNLKACDQEWAGVGVQMIDDFFGPVFKRFLDGILASLGSRSSPTSYSSNRPPLNIPKSQPTTPEDDDSKIPTSGPRDR